MLAAILGEVRGISGRVKIQGSLAYVPQQPWVMSGTLRDNILFKKQVCTFPQAVPWKQGPAMAFFRSLFREYPSWYTHSFANLGKVLTGCTAAPCCM